MEKKIIEFFMNNIDIEKIILNNKNKFALIHLISMRTREIIIKNQKEDFKLYIDKPFLNAIKEFELEAINNKK